MSSEDTAIEKLSIKDEGLEELLDAVDSRTHQQEIFHNLMSDGFMSLARERYRDPSSTERLGRLVYDEREDVSSDVYIDVQEDKESGIVAMTRTSAQDIASPERNSTEANLRRRRTKESEKIRTPSEKPLKSTHENVKNTFMAMPSKEIREAIKCFKLAVDHAVDLVNTNNKLNVALDKK